MIIGLWHPGSGVGDQLFCYLAARITAERLGVPFTMVGESKSDTFITTDRGLEVDVPYHVEYPAGKIVIDNDWPIYEGRTYYDPEFNFIEDNTIVDGCRVQDERYFDEYNLRYWLKCEYLEMLPNLCVINFRGGEFAAIPDLFLPQEYWDKAIQLMTEKGFTEFEVHTDDPATAQRFFPQFKVIHDVGLNWRSVRYAKGAIIANSAFGIIPRLLAQMEADRRREDCFTVAPRYWARRNLKEWSTPQNYYSHFLYV
jgi:hypothetical protein